MVEASDTSAKIEGQQLGADDDSQRLMAEVRQPLAVCVWMMLSRDLLPLYRIVLSKRGEKVRKRVRKRKIKRGR